VTRFTPRQLQFPARRPIQVWMMTSTPSIALSGMAAAQARLDSAAHNIANAQTPGFRRQTTESQTLSGGGVSTSFTREESAGADLATDLVGQHEALYAFKANLRTLEVADDMLGTLIDAFA